MLHSFYHVYWLHVIRMFSCKHPWERSCKHGDRPHMFSWIDALGADWVSFGQRVPELWDLKVEKYFENFLILFQVGFNISRFFMQKLAPCLNSWTNFDESYLIRRKIERPRKWTFFGWILFRGLGVFQKKNDFSNNDISSLRTSMVDWSICFQTWLSGIGLGEKHYLTVKLNKFASLRHGVGVTWYEITWYMAWHNIYIGRGH